MFIFSSSIVSVLNLSSVLLLLQFKRHENFLFTMAPPSGALYLQDTLLPLRLISQSNSNPRVYIMHLDFDTRLRHLNTSKTRLSEKEKKERERERRNGENNAKRDL